MIKRLIIVVLGLLLRFIKRTSFQPFLISTISHFPQMAGEVTSVDNYDDSDLVGFGLAK